MGAAIGGERRDQKRIGLPEFLEKLFIDVWFANLCASAVVHFVVVHQRSEQWFLVGTNH